MLDDIVDGIVRLMNTPDEITGPINLGSREEFTIRGLADKILSLTGSKSPLVEAALPDDDPRQRQPDITLARERLEWQPTTQVEQGLKSTIEYFEALLRNDRL